MYNRYVPQSDGSYRRSPIPDPPSPSETSPPSSFCIQNTPLLHPKQGQNCATCVQQTPPFPPPKRSSPPVSPLHFLRNLLPRDFDTDDLLVVLLLLLMAGDDQQDQNSALLTLALYLFL